MPSYTQYMRQMAVMDASDDDIESWITVKGNHIPIKKGQSKEDAVKEFISKKSDKEFSKRAEKPQSIGEATKKVVSQVKENRETNKAAKKEYPAEFETVRKNAKANPYLYDLRYTQKSKAKAYEEYKKDTEKEAPTPAQQHATTRNIMTLFSKHYEDLYDGKTKSNRELVKEFDNKMANDPEFKKQVQAFVKERGDVLSSDREVQAYMMAYNTVKSKLEPAMKKLEEYHKKDTEKKDKAYNDKGLYQDALNELDDQIADKEKELENIHLAMTQNAEAGYFDIANSNMMDIEFVEGQLKELKKKREKLAGTGKAPKGNYTFHDDAGHGWLEVPLDEVRDLGIEVSSASYMDDKNAYLEEDLDMQNFIKAYKEKYGKAPDETRHYDGQSSPIREKAFYKK